MLAWHDGNLERRTMVKTRGRAGWLMVAALLAWTFATGFMIFATHAMRPPETARDTAAGIVVLTGADLRLREGARLLEAGRAGRLLVSGVNARTRPEVIQRLTGLDPALFNCCVELGYKAQSTVGNAEETRDWALANGFSSLIVVTSTYHMPRSLAELELVLPHVRLIPHAVAPKAPRRQPWWLNPGTARILFGEYVKYLPVAARAGLARLFTARPAATARTSTTSAVPATIGAPSASRMPP